MNLMYKQADEVMGMLPICCSYSHQCSELGCITSQVIVVILVLLCFMQDSPATTLAIL